MFKKISAIIAVMMLFVLQAAVYVQAQQAGSAAAPAQSATPAPSVSPQPSVAPAQSASPAAGLPQMTPGQAAAYQSLSPAQQQAIQGELGKTGGKVTPQAVDALKGRPEFQGVSPAEIEKGKQMLEQKEKAAEKAPEKPIEKASDDAKEKGAEKIEKKNLPWEEKTIIGEEAVENGLFDRSRRVGKYQDVSLSLQLFGSDFFRESAVRVVTDRKDIPVPLKYVIGPGDEVKLLLWGRLNAQYNLTVDRDGKITIPQVGPMFVAGMTFEEMSKHLITQAEQIVGTNIDVSMGALKTISVFVLGDVRKPGAYTIGSFATITDALVMVGGASNIGSMRRVQLRRNNKLVTTFDLYDLLLKGDKSKDVILQSGDVIFVPVAGPLVGIAGNVKRPAIYELKDKHDLHTVIENAGGIIPTAYTQQIQVERIIKGEKHVVVDINDKNLEHASQFQLQDADLVKIFSIVDANVNAVYINGNVKRPGKYEYKPGMTIRDILSRPDELLPETHYDYALIRRLTPPSMEAALVPFNLGKLIFDHDPAQNIALMPQDQIYIFSKWFFQEKPHFSISGEVRKGGRFDLPDNFTVKDAILAAGDLTKEAYLKKGEIVRVNQQREYKTIYFNVANALAGDVGDNVLLKDEDRIVIHSIWEERWREVVSVVGEIKNPLQTQLTESMRVSDLVFKAGGVTRDTYYNRAELYRTDWRTKEVTLREIDLGKALAKDPENNLLLKDLDRLVVHSVREKIFEKTVSIDGDVHKPGTYRLAEKMTVRDLVFAAGNVTEAVYLDDAEIATMRVEDGKTAKISVRNINLRKALAGDTAHNVELHPYDRVFVKRIVDWRQERYVTLAGQVKFPGRYMLSKGERLSSVIARAGGYTDEAYLRGAVFTREKVRQMQQKSIEEITDRLEKELLSQGAAGVATALSAEEVAAKKAEMEQKKQFIDAMRKSKAMGRMTIKLAHLRLLKGSEYDVEIEDGDTLMIPEKTSVVGVVGAVMSSGAHVYSERKEYKDYIDMSGGYTRYADKDNVYVLKVDGSARKAYNGFVGWNDKKDRHELAAFSDADVYTIEPGDVVAVPENFERVAWLREFRDISQILANIAFASGNMVLLIRSF
ncbi:MAG: SLBB domain-containing protein [Syntrophaceae bacterium]|nr:SLBB domain-containing protein [Syntrophaceae bacterium]